MKALDFTVGDRVRLHPSLDAFARGMHYGTVTSLAPNHVRVFVELFNKRINVHPDNLQKVDDAQR